MRSTCESASHPDDLGDYNLFSSNAALVDALERERAPGAHRQLAELGSVAEAVIASRIASGAPAAFGVLPVGLDHGALIERAFKL